MICTLFSEWFFWKLLSNTKSLRKCESIFLLEKERVQREEDKKEIQCYIDVRCRFHLGLQLFDMDYRSWKDLFSSFNKICLIGRRWLFLVESNVYQRSAFYLISKSNFLKDLRTDLNRCSCNIDLSSPM